jgi:hypothetical protein
MKEIKELIEIIEQGWSTAIKESHHNNFDQREYHYGKTQQASKPILDGYEAWQTLRKLLSELESKTDESK